MDPHTSNRCFKQCVQILAGLACCLMLFQTRAAAIQDTGLAAEVKRRPNHPLELRNRGNSADEPSRLPADASTLQEPVGVMVLSQALALALTRNPQLAAFSNEIRAREAATLQASLIPNPVLGVQASNFANNTFSGADADVVTLQLSQLIELGGKRAARTEAAALNKELADWDYETQRIAVLTQVTKDFIEVLAAQRRLQLAQQLIDLADQVVKSATARVQAGSVTPLEETKAKVMRASTKIEWNRAQRELQAKRKRLAASWGSTEARFDSVQGELTSVRQPPSLQQLLQRIKLNPNLARWATEISQRQALVRVEESKVIPNITVSLGTNKYLDGDNYNLNAGISMPLPLFNRNQGNVMAAERQLNKAKDERRHVEVQMTTELNTVYQQLHAAYAEIVALQETVIPGAETAFKAADRGYRLGEFGILDVLDAQRTLFGVKIQYLQSLADYHLNVADIERLLGGSLNPSTETSSESLP